MGPEQISEQITPQSVFILAYLVGKKSGHENTGGGRLYISNLNYTVSTSMWGIVMQVALPMLVI